MTKQSPLARWASAVRLAGRAVASTALALLAVAGVAQAQEAAQITGRVVSEAGAPIAGASVFIQSLNAGAITNEAGRYTLVVPAARVTNAAATITARFIGFTPQSKEITLRGGQQTVDFELAVDVNRLSAVVVTGVTGATERVKVPFTVAQVTAEDMPVVGANPLAQLQGKVAGVNIVANTGRPGAAPSVILRGPQSINASGRGQEPLYIIDGVVSQGGLQDINPADIENIEVVKGAAAASLYGSRAGNGVINITTKSGKSSPEGVRFRAQMEYGQSDIEREYQYPRTHFMMMTPDLQRFCVNVSGQPSCSRSVDIDQEARRINEDGGDFSLPPATFTNDGGIARNLGQVLNRGLYQIDPFPITRNPIQDFLTNGETYNATVDATGRVGRTNFFASINQFRQEGAVRFQPGYTRNTFRLNVDQGIGEDLDFSFRSSYADAVDFNSGLGTAWFRLTRQPANANVLARDNQGRLFIRSVPQQQGAQNQNPAYLAEQVQPFNRIQRFVGSATARWRPLSWMDVEGQFGFDQRSNQQEYQEDRGFRTTAANNANLGFLSRDADRSYSMNASLNATMRKAWFNDESLQSRLTLRYLWEEQDDRGVGLEGTNLVVAGLADPDAAIENFDIDGFRQTVRQVGYFANLDLDYKDRYILSGLVRRDASSLFGRARRWQTYGRTSAAWRVAQESWFNVPGVTELKLRGSVGTAGNRPSFAAQYETFSIGAGGSLQPNTLGNRNLRPEVSREVELGGELELFSRYGLEVVKARNVIDDQLLQVPPSAASGFSNQWINAGQLTNNTWEVSLNLPLVQRRDLTYSVRINYDRTRSEITKLDVPTFPISAGAQGATTMFFAEEGRPFAEIYGRRFATSCSDLPSNLQGRCGGAGSAYQTNDDGLIVYVGEGNTLGDGITKNLWYTLVPEADAPFGTTQGWGLPVLVRDSAGNVDTRQRLGNALPDFRWSMAHNFQWKRLTVYGLLDATVGKEVFNRGRQWSLGDYMHRDADQSGATVATAKPVGYYFRAGPSGGSSGIGGLYDVLGPNNWTVEDAGFVKLRELSVTYNVGAIRGMGNWTVSLIGRNLITWTDYSDFDPEVGLGGGTLGSGVLNAIDANSFPNLRTFTFSVQTSF